MATTAAQASFEMITSFSVARVQEAVEKGQKCMFCGGELQQLIGAARLAEISLTPAKMLLVLVCSAGCAEKFKAHPQSERWIEYNRKMTKKP